MSVTFRSGSQDTANANSIALPAGTAAGDVLILATCGNGATALPSGFIQLFSGNSGNNLYGYKIATNSEPSTYSYRGSASVASAVLACYTGVASVGQIVAISNGVSTTGSSSFGAGTLDDTYITGSLVVGAWNEQNSGTGVTITVPTGFTSRVQITNPSGATSFAGTIGDISGPSPGSTYTPPNASTSSSGSGETGFCLVLRPQASNPVAKSVCTHTCQQSGTGFPTTISLPMANLQRYVPGCDALIATVSWNGGGGVTLTPSTGWTLVASAANMGVGASATFTRMYWRLSDGSANDSFLGTLSGGAEANGLMYVVNGVRSPVDQTNLASGTGTTLGLGTVTTTGPNELVVYAITDNSNGVAVAPTGTSQSVNITGGASAFCSTFCSELQATAGTTTSRTATNTSASGNVGITAAFFGPTSAPSAPTLTAPANASYDDVSGGQIFSSTYNATDGANQNAYALRIKTSLGSYNYWNASGNVLQTTIVWNTISTTPGSSFNVTVPGTAITNGNTYNWSMASQEAAANLQGQFASDFTFTSQAAPGLVINGPIGTAPSATPVISWTTTPGGTAVQTSYRVVIEHGTFGTTPGSGTQDWDSGTITSPAQSVTSGVNLTNSVTYRVFVMVTETGGQASSWVFATFTVTYDTPAAPTITAVVGTDGATGCPRVAITVQALDNLLSALDASFEGGVGTFTATGNCTIATSNAQALDGSSSLAMTATAGAGSMTAATAANAYAVTPGSTYTALASLRANSVTHSIGVSISWYTSGGALISTSAGTLGASSTTAWTQVIETAVAPVGAAFAQVILTAGTSAIGQIHFADCVGIFPGTVTTWFRGGLVGSTFGIVLRSDGSYVRLASLVNPQAIPASTQQFTVFDYEALPGVAYTYQAQVIYTINAQSVVSAFSAASAGCTVTTTAWWWLDPTNPSTAVAANPINWAPIQVEMSTARPVIGQVVQNMVSDVVLNQDFSGTIEFFASATYSGFQSLVTSGKTIFCSSPWGSVDSGWFRVGPSSGSGGGGSGSTVKSTTLMPSTSNAPHRTMAVTAIAQARPSV